MKGVISLLILGAFLSACAGTEADLERARYLLAKGGTANGNKALSILQPYMDTDPPSLQGEQLLELYRLYAGANMTAAGYDSVSISGALIFSGQSNLLAALGGSTTNLASTVATLLNTASAALDAAIASSAYSSLPTSKDSIKRGLQYQRALVDLLKSIRVLVNGSGFSSESFTAAKCAASLSLGAELNQGVTSIYDARDRMRDTNGVGLSESNEIVTALNDLITEVDGDGDRQIADSTQLQTLCNYLQEQKGLSQ